MPFFQHLPLTSSWEQPWKSSLIEGASHQFSILIPWDKRLGVRDAPARASSMPPMSDFTDQGSSRGDFCCVCWPGSCGIRF